jgi:hypothetical protein
MNKLSKEKRDKLIMVCLGTGCLLALLNFFLIGAQQDSLSELDRIIADKKDKVQKANQMVTMAPRIQSNLHANQRVLDTKEDRMAAPVDQYRWITELVPPFMTAHNVNFEECTPKPRIELPGLLPKFTDYKSAVFGVKATARFHDFGKFLADFENEFPYMTIQNLKMRPEGAKNVRALSGPESLLRPAGRNARAEIPEPSEKLLFDMKIVTLIKP